MFKIRIALYSVIFMQHNSKWVYEYELSPIIKNISQSMRLLDLLSLWIMKEENVID
jgi:hypothetical protein